MANKDRPRGFEPYGAPKKVIEMTAGAAVYPGDCVHLESDGKVDPAIAGEDVFGVALSYASADGEKLRVSIDPDQVYICQADEADIDAQTDVGNLCDILATAGNTTYKASRQEVDSSSIGTGSGGQLVILGIEDRPDNALGAQVDVLVKINENQAMGETDFAGI